MFKKILVPVDLGHLETLSRALGVAGDLAKSNGAEIVYASVYGNQSIPGLPQPNEHADALEAFAAREGAAQGISASALPIFSHDPDAELGSALVSAAGEIDADAIVMASHIPGWVEHIFHSNAGYVACHSSASVFVVR